jgi:hypothetical protein
MGHIFDIISEIYDDIWVMSGDVFDEVDDGVCGVVDESV